MADLLIGLVAGVFGVAYFVYGRKAARFTPMLAGALLCVYPYFVGNPWVSAAIGLALAAAPFLTDF